MSNILVDTNDVNYNALYNQLGGARHNGLYYYAKTIENYIIPKVKTSRPWNTIGLKACGGQNGMIVFIHANLQPEKDYTWLKKFTNIVCVSNSRRTAEKMLPYSYSIYLPPSVDVKGVRKIAGKVKKDQDSCFAGNPWPAYRKEIDTFVPAWVHRFGTMPREELLPILAHYKNVYAIGLTAVEARALGCNIMKRTERYDPEDFPLFDCEDAAKCLQVALDLVDKEKPGKIVDCTKFPEFRDRKQK